MQCVLGITTKQRCENEKKYEYKKGTSRNQNTVCGDKLGVLIFFKYVLAWFHKTGNRFGWKFQKAYGAAPSDSLLWRLTAHRDQRLLSNKLSGPKTWHRHLVSCWQRFAAPAPAVSQSPYWGSVSKFYSQHRLLFWISTPQILYSLLDSSPTVRCSHRYGKPWMVLSQLHHCSHSACFHVCTISQQTVPTLVFDVPGTGKLLFIQLEWKKTWNTQTWNAKHERR